MAARPALIGSWTVQRTLGWTIGDSESRDLSARAVLLPLEVGLQRACVACQPSKGKKAKGSQGGQLQKGSQSAANLVP